MARPRPTGRERLVIWGDGDIAIFETCQQSKKEGHLLFKFRPTPQMESNKNIDPSHYDEMDHLINRIYPKDICIQFFRFYYFPGIINYFLLFPLFSLIVFKIPNF